MSVTKSLKISLTGVSGAAAAAALMLGGAGTAQAETAMWTSTDALGVTVHIHSSGASPSSGWCNYTAVPVAGTTPTGVKTPWPVYDVPFQLQENGTHDLWLPGIQTGTTWDATVNCPGGANSGTVQLVY